MDSMVKVTYIANNIPHIGHWTWVMILKHLFSNDFRLISLNRPSPTINSIVITEGVKPTLYGLTIKPLNKCLAAIALSPSIIQPRINTIYSRADVGIAISNMVKDLITSKKKVVIYPRPPELEHLLRVSIDVDGKKPWICYSGPLIPIKGIHLIPEVARHVINDVKGAKFLVIGDGARDPIIKRAKKYGLDDSIIITGYMPRTELFKLLKKCSVYIQLSLFDAFPVSVIEAMALSCVPVITKYVGSRDIVAKVDDSLIQEYDTAGIAGKIVEVLSNKDVFRELAVRSRYVVGEELSISKVKGQVIEVIEECLR